MKQKKTNIVLIGMPGVGKSTVGVILAKIIGYKFVDTDLVIQEQTGKKLSKLIEKLGADGFIQLENDINAGLEAEHSVIATGGSVVYGNEAMEHLKETGVVVYLKQDMGQLKRRLRNIRGRGVVLKDGQTLDDLFEERSVLYEKYADVVVDEFGLDVEQTIAAVRTAIAPWVQENGTASGGERGNC